MALGKRRERTEESMQREYGSNLLNIWNTTKYLFNNSSELETRVGRGSISTVTV
jgi:hypothetical protein